MRGLTATARANAFAAAVDGAPGSEGDRLVLLTRRLQQLPLATPPGLPGTLRTAVLGAAVTAAATASAPSVRVHPSASSGPAGPGLAGPAAGGSATAGGAAAGGALQGLVPFVAGTLITAIGATGIGAAAERSTPGMAFYGVKRAVERAQLDLAPGRAAAARARLGFAAARLHEASVLATPSAPSLTTSRLAGLLGAAGGDLAEATPPLLAGSSGDQALLGRQLQVAAGRLHALASSLPAALQPQVRQLLGQIAATRGVLAAVTGAPAVTGNSPATGNAPGAGATPGAGGAGTRPSGAPGPAGSPSGAPAAVPSGGQPAAVAPGVPTGVPAAAPTLAPVPPASLAAPSPSAVPGLPLPTAGLPVVSSPVPATSSLLPVPLPTSGPALPGLP